MSGNGLARELTMSASGCFTFELKKHKTFLHPQEKESGKNENNNHLKEKSNKLRKNIHNDEMDWS